MPVIEASAVLAGLPADAAEALLALVGPAADCPQIVVEIRQLGGAMAQGPDADYVQRDAAFSLHTVGLAVPPLREAVAAHGHAVVSALAPWSTGGLLPNFSPRADAAWYRSTYGEAGVARLREVVLAHDPRNVLAGSRALRAATD